MSHFPHWNFYCRFLVSTQGFVACSCTHSALVTIRMFETDAGKNIVVRLLAFLSFSAFGATNNSKQSIAAAAVAEAATKDSGWTHCHLLYFYCSTHPTMCVRERDPPQWQMCCRTELKERRAQANCAHICATIGFTARKWISECGRLRASPVVLLLLFQLLLSLLMPLRDEPMSVLQQIFKKV